MTTIICNLLMYNKVHYRISPSASRDLNAIAEYYLETNMVRALSAYAP